MQGLLGRHWQKVLALQGVGTGLGIVMAMGSWSRRRVRAVEVEMGMWRTRMLRWRWEEVVVARSPWIFVEVFNLSRCVCVRLFIWFVAWWYGAPVCWGGGQRTTVFVSLQKVPDAIGEWERNEIGKSKIK